MVSELATQLPPLPLFPPLTSPHLWICDGRMCRRMVNRATGQKRVVWSMGAKPFVCLFSKALFWHKLPTMAMEMVARTTTMRRAKGARNNEMLKGMTSAESCWVTTTRKKQAWLDIIAGHHWSSHRIVDTREHLCICGAVRWRRRGERRKSWRATQGLMNSVCAFHWVHSLGEERRGTQHRGSTREKQKQMDRSEAFFPLLVWAPFLL